MPGLKTGARVFPCQDPNRGLTLRTRITTKTGPVTHTGQLDLERNCLSVSQSVLCRSPAMSMRTFAAALRTAAAGGPSRSSSRLPVAGVNGTQHCSFG
jgi:hypothetical protein